MRYSEPAPAKLNLALHVRGRVPDGRHRLETIFAFCTDGDVVENAENTRREVDFIVTAAAIQPHSNILDLCCGQGRHCLELARRGFRHVMGVDIRNLSSEATRESAI